MGLLEIIAVILVIAWLGGFALNLVGDAVHILLVVAIVVFILRFFRRAV
jgi:hypothetical protein